MLWPIAVCNPTKSRQAIEKSGISFGFVIFRKANWPGGRGLSYGVSDFSGGVVLQPEKATIKHNTESRILFFILSSKNVESWSTRGGLFHTLVFLSACELIFLGKHIARTEKSLM